MESYTGVVSVSRISLKSLNPTMSLCEYSKVAISDLYTQTIIQIKMVRIDPES